MKRNIKSAYVRKIHVKLFRCFSTMFLIVFVLFICFAKKENSVCEQEPVDFPVIQL